MNLLHVLEVAMAFGFMIFIHEGGHYAACRLFGVDVEEFSLGFGNILFSRKWGKTLYSIRAFPLGGFCKPKGGDLSGQSAEEMYARAPEPGEFLHASWWKRILIFLAGPGMNFVSALFILSFLFLVKGEIIPVEKPLLGFVPPGTLAAQAGLRQGDLLLKADGKDITNLDTAYDDLMPDYGQSVVVTVQRKGKTFDARIERPAKPVNQWAAKDWLHGALAALGFGPTPSEPDLGIGAVRSTVVGEALLGNPARNAGLQDGDEITAIDGQKVSDWSQLSYLIKHTQADPLKVQFLRNGQPHEISIQRVYNGEFKAIGIMPEPLPPGQMTTQKVSLVKAVSDGTAFSVNKTRELAGGIWMLVTGKVSLKDSVAGPVTIMRLMYHQASKWEDFFTVVSIISLVLFLMNLLPIPVVDGGQIVLCFIEGVKRSPVSVKLQMVYQQVGFFLIIGLMALAVFNDFKNIFLEVHNHIH